MCIAGRYVSERERLHSMTDAERAFRKQWLQDQILSKNEPRPVPEMYKALYNPLRRFYRWPLDRFQKMLEPTLGHTPSYMIRYFTGKGLMMVGVVYWFAYYAKYNSNDWTRKAGWKVKKSRRVHDLGDEEFPKLSERSKPSEYYSRGFDKNTLNLVNDR